MDIPKVTDGELSVLNVLWEKGKIPATEIVKELKQVNNWNRNTTYTFINRLVDKKVISREEPGFICDALFTKEEVSVSEAKTFLEKMFNGSLNMLVTSFINREKLDEKEMNQIKKLIDSKYNGGETHDK